MSASVEAAFELGAIRVVLPPTALSSAVLNELMFLSVVERDGYEEIARQELERLTEWLTRPEDLAFPGEAPKGRKLTDGVLDSDAGLSWYVIRSATRREKEAEAMLIEQGFAVYLPREARIRRKAGQKYRVETALLPGYLFVGLRSAQTDGAGHDVDMAAVLGTEGVHDFVRISRERAPLRAPFLGKQSITSLLNMEIDGVFDRARKIKRERPAKGQAVTVDGGSFQGWPATFEGIDEKGRVRLAMHMFGRWTQIVLDQGDVAELREEP